MDKSDLIDRIADWMGGWKIVNPFGILLLSISAWFFSLTMRNLLRGRGGDRQRKD